MQVVCIALLAANCQALVHKHLPNALIVADRVPVIGGLRGKAENIRSEFSANDGKSIGTICYVCVRDGHETVGRGEWIRTTDLLVPNQDATQKQQVSRIDTRFE